MADPSALIQQMLAQGGAPQPGGMTPPGLPPGGPPPMQPDEMMLSHVQGAMGAPQGTEGGPPPGSGMKWQNLEEDQQALQADPSPENVQAFIQYWGEENLPEGIAAQPDEAEASGPPEGAEGEY
jgi:hypothetical protein